MIHVQIASQVTTTGVEGVRWVLLDSGPAGAGPGAAAPDQAPAADASAAGPAHPAGAGLAAGPPAAPAGRPTGLIKLLVVCLALGAALWLAQTRLGPLAQRAGPSRAAPTSRAPVQAAAPLQPASAVPMGPVAVELR